MKDGGIPAEIPPKRVVLELFLTDEMRTMQKKVEEQITRETGFTVARKQISQRIYFEGILTLAEKFNLKGMK